MFKRKNNKSRDNLNRPRNPNQAKPVSRSVNFYRSDKNIEIKESDTEKRLSDRAKADKSKHKLLVIFSLILIFGFVLYSNTVSSSVRVGYANDYQSPYNSTNNYAEFVDGIINKSLSNKTKITINTKAIEKELLDNFPEVDNASLSLPIVGRRPNLILSVRRPVAVLIAGPDSYIIDSRGFIVSDIKDLALSERQKLPVIIDESGMEVKVGTQILPSDTIDFILNAKHQVESKSLSINKLVLPVRLNELDIYINDQNYYIKTDTTGDARVQLGGYFAVSNSLRSKGISPSEYIDVRVEEKVFYK